MNKTQEKWKEYLASVPGLAASIQSDDKAVDDDSANFSSFVSALPGEVSGGLGDVQDKEELSLKKSIEHHWCLCDMPEGEFPRVYVYSSLPRLIEAIEKREGDETAVWAMYGIPLRLTKTIKLAGNKQSRYLLLPNNMAAVVGGQESGKIIDQSLLPDDLAVQEEGWLGDPDYLEDQHYFLDTNSSIADDSFSDDMDLDSDDE